MNPYFLGSETKAGKEVLSPREERDEPGNFKRLPSVSLGLRLGRLLIRMGSKLAHDDAANEPAKNVVS